MTNWASTPTFCCGSFCDDDPEQNRHRGAFLADACSRITRAMSVVMAILEIYWVLDAATRFRASDVAAAIRCNAETRSMSNSKTFDCIRRHFRSDGRWQCRFRRCPASPHRNRECRLQHDHDIRQQGGRAHPRNGTSGMSDPARLITPEKRGEDIDTALRPQIARRIHRPGGSAGQSEGVHRGGEEPWRGARPCAVRRPARPRQDDAGADHGARNSASISARPPAR